MKKETVTNSYLLNGEICSGSDKPPAPTHHLLIYEVLRIEKGTPLFIDDHLERLCRGVKKVGHTLLSTKVQLKSNIEKLSSTSVTGRGNIKLEFYFLEDNLNEVESRAFFIPTHYPSQELYTTGIKCMTLEKERVNPSVKASNNSLRILTNELIGNHHVYEVLLHSSNYLTEGSRSNLFFIKEETLITAPDELVLSGVMRKKVLEIIRQKNIPLKMEALPVNKLSSISAAFITGTSPRVLPIYQIDDNLIQPYHPLVVLIREELQKTIDQYIAQYEME